MGFLIKIDKERCKGCELCIEVCSKSLLSMSSAINSKGAHFPEISSQDDCQGCLQCSIICPDAAIEIEQNNHDHE